jgi:LysM repeat protein
MQCNVKTNSIKYLEKYGATDDVRRIINEPLFDELNKKLTDLAIEKYGLDSDGATLFSVNMSDHIDRMRSTYYRDAKYKIYRAVPNEQLFKELQTKFDQQQGGASDSDINPEPQAPMFMRTPGFQSETNAKFDAKLKNAMIDFLRGLNITVESDLKEVISAQKRTYLGPNGKMIVKDDPIAAFDLLQKFMGLKEGITNKQLARQTAYVIHSFLGKKSKLGIELWKGIDSWSKYQYFYDKYSQPYTNVVEEDVTTDEAAYGNLSMASEVIKKAYEYDPERFNPYAHKQAIIEFMAEMVIAGVDNNYIGEKRKNPDISKDYFESIGYRDKYAQNWFVKIFNQFMNWIQEHIFKNKAITIYSEQELIDTAMDLVDDVYKKDYTKFIRNYALDPTTGKFYSSKGDEFEIKEFWKSVNSDPFAKDIMDKLLTKAKFEYFLSGSMVLRKYGRVVRPVNEEIHDIDGVISLKQFESEPNYKEFLKWIEEEGIPLSKERSTKNSKKFMDGLLPFLEDQNWYKELKEMFPTWQLETAFIGRDHKKGESITITGYVEHPTETEIVGDVTESYGGRLSEKTVTRPKRYILDFFLRTAEGNYPEVFDHYYKDWKQIMEAKIMMGRGKDLTDLIYFVPNRNDKFKYTNRGFRYFSFADKTGPGSVVLSSYEQDTLSMPEIDPFFNIPLIDMDIKTLQDARSREVAEVLGQKLAQGLGVDYVKITAEEATELLKNRSIAYNGEPAFYYAGAVYIVGDNVSVNTVLHEFSHPLLQAIRHGNQKLFNNLYRQLKGTVEGEQIIAHVKRNYPELSEESDLFKEEALAFALQRRSVNKVVNQIETEGFDNFIKKLLAALKEALRKIFGSKVDVKNLNENTTLDELADMLLEKDFEFDTEAITDEDLVMYGRFVTERADTLKTSVKAEAIMQAIKEVFDTNKRSITNAREFKTDKVIRKMIEEALFRKGTTEFLPAISDSLSGYKDEDNSKLSTDEIIDSALNAEEKRLEELTNRSVALVNSIDKINSVAKNMMADLKKISKMPNINTRNVIALIGLYKNTAYAWQQTINEIDALIYDQFDPEQDNLFYQTMNEISNNLSRVQTMAADIYKSNNIQFFVEITGYMNEFVTTRLNENLGIALKKAFSGEELEKAVMSIYNKVLDQTFDDADKNELIQKGVPADILEKFIKEYKDFVVDPEKIKNALTGNAKDVSWFNRWMESYSSSNDIIVGPLSIFIQDQRTEVENEVWKKSQDFRKKLEALLPRVGFSKLNTTQMRDMLSEEDTIMWFDPKTGEPMAKTIYTFLNEFGNGWRYQQDMLEYALEEAKKTGDKDKISLAAQELREFNADFMWQEFVPEYYEKNEIFKQSKAGELAYIARKQALDKYNNLVNQFDNELSRFENYTAVQAAWREFQQLYSLYYEDGTPKVDDPVNGIYDLSMAKVMSEYKENTSKFNEFVPIPGSLQTSYNEFVSLLESQDITKGSKDFKLKMKEWTKQNTRVVYSDEFYEERGSLYTRLRSIQDRINSVIKSDFDISDAYKQISDLIFSYRDEHGQPITTQLGEDKLKKIKKLNQQIIDYREKFQLSTGLTSDQAEEFEMLNKVARSEKLSEIQENRYVYLVQLQKNSGITLQDATDMQDIFAQLSGLSMKEPTDYYMEALNYNLSKQNIKEVSEDDVDELINSDEFWDILQTDDEFMSWFEMSHVERQKYQKGKGKITVFERTSANSVTVPTNPKHLKSTQIIDTETGETITIKGVPNSRHSRYQVKNEYRTIPLGASKEDYIGKYIDNKGNPLPRPYELGTKNSAKDDRFISKRYADLKRSTNSAVFELLEATKEYHLESQKDQSNYGKLYLDVPRYAIKKMDIYQAFQRGKYGERFRSLSTTSKEWLRQTFGKSVVDGENDLNYDAQNNLVNTDLEGNEVSYIPITGIYNLETEITDADIFQGLFKYSLSIQTQGKLLESLPLVQGVLATLEDPANKPKNMDRFSKGAFNLRNKLQNTNKEGAENNRLGQVRSLIEREYYGKQVTGLEENHPRIGKWLNMLQGASAKASLAINLSSDLKNKYSGYVQLIIEGAGAEFITLRDIALATPWATKAMLDWTSKDIYATGPGTLSGQLIQIFDPTFKSVDEFGRSVTRSMVKDLVNMEWMYMHRKFGEMEVAMKLFGSFMHGQKIDQVLSDGTVKSIRYIDAWELDSNGVAKLKPGVHPGWNNVPVYHTYVKGETIEELAKRYHMEPDELRAKNRIKSETQWEDGQEIVIAKSEKYKAFKNRMQAVSRKLFGVYDRMGQPEGNKMILYRMFFFMRKWFTPMFVNRFGMDTSSENFGGHRYDWALGKYTKGFYVSAFQSMWRIIKSKGRDFQYLTPDEKSAFIRASAEGLMLIMTAVIASALLGWDPDDDEKMKKLRKKSGAFNERNFDTYGFLSNHALNLLLGVQAETGAFVPLPSIFGLNLGADDYVKLITSTSTSFSNTIVLYTQILGDFLNFITFDDAGRYKQDAGPLWFQKEGELKFWKRIFKTVGFTGGTGDPATLIENLNQSASRIGGS